MLKTLHTRKPGPLLEILAETFHLSKRQAKHLLDQKRVSINGQRVWMAKHKLKKGDKIEVYLEKTADEAPFKFLYQDPYLFVVSKPSGISATGKHSFSEQVKALHPEARLIHRLDKDTTGCLLFARNRAVEEKLIEVFKRKDIRKQYVAIACGRPPTKHHHVRETLDEKPAETRFTCEKKAGPLSLLRIEIITGRTHQIRRHLEKVGCAVLGDVQYGLQHQPKELSPSPPRCLLHAERLEFIHPETSQKVKVRAPLPKDFLQSMKAYGFSRR
jgi:23S rRNA-/tRNA-specific pseudouridylate synthase